MELNVIGARLGVSIAGAFLYFVIGVLAVRFPRKQAQERLIGVLAFLLSAWSIVALLDPMHRLIAGEIIPWYLDLLHFLNRLFLSLAALTGVALALLWSGLPAARALAAGAVTLVLLLLSWSGGVHEQAILAVGVACFLLVAFAASKQDDPLFRRYLTVLSLTLAFPVVVEVLSPDGAMQAFTRILPIACTIYFITRYSVFGFLISRRFLYLNAFTGVSALYLLAIRVFASFGEAEYEWFGRIFEVVMILLAAILWLPLYGWMFRSLTRRAENFAEFNEHLIQEAVRILELGHRAQFLADQIARRYALRRVVIYSLPDHKSWSSGAAPEFPVSQLDTEPLASASRETKASVIHMLRARDPQVRKVLASRGFNYVFPLWYDEENLSGLLLVDSSPRAYLDDVEPVLASLARQVAHSLEACRLVEEKIVLEKTLVRQEQLATLGKVAATIAHEVKNPLSSIKTLAQLMREDDEVNQRYEQDLRFIIGETDRLNSCVQQLLTFARPVPDAGIDVSLNDLLGDITKAIGREYQKQQIRIEHEVQPDLRLRGADMQSIQQIVMNLTLNAMQASGPGETVRLAANREPDGRIAITVTDHGPGIPGELREKIFEPFFTTKQKGTGLGLAIVRKNVRHLNGDLQVTSPFQNGRGTSIRVTFPADASS